MASTLPKLRTDLRITRQKQRGEVIFVVKDPLTESYFRYSEMEFQVMSLFDGRHTPEQIIEEFRAIDTEAELNRETIAGFQSSLKNDGLLEQSAAEKNLILLEKQRAYRKHRLLSAKGSIMYLRFPLLDPNKLLDRTIDYIRFFWTPTFVILSLLAILASYAIIAANWEQVYQSLREMYSFNNQSLENMVRLWIVIIVVIALHEFGHAYTCKHFGGEVHEIGFLLMMVINPCLYANVNDAWTFPEKSHKLWVTFAGGYFEAFIGALATFAWWMTNPGSTLNTYCYAALTVCSISSLAFNFNPLVKLDGYYALSDYLELPNLRQRAGDYTSYWINRHILRRHIETDELDPRTRRVLLIYGILSKLWITTILLAVFFMFRDLLISTFHEFGIVLVGGIVGYLFRRKIGQLGSTIWNFIAVPQGEHRAARRRNHAVFIILAIIVASWFTQTNVYITTDCHLEPSRCSSVRAQGNGFIREIHVTEGAVVQQGQTLFVMEDPYQTGTLARLALDKAMAEADVQHYQGTANPSAMREAQVRLHQLSQSLDATRRQAETLAIRAPVNGTILTADLAPLMHSYARKGLQLCEIGDLSQMHVVIPVNETESGLVDIGDPVEVRVPAFPDDTFRGAVVSMSTQADTTAMDHSVQVRLAIENSRQLLRTGMTGTARILAHRESWLAYMGRLLLKTVRMDLWF